jgi:glutamate-1-semialdehyde 2,1-aminomutase
MTRGIPRQTSELVKTFNYNDIDSVKCVIDEFEGQIACLVMEPATSICPSTNFQGSPCCGGNQCNRFTEQTDTNFLKQVQQICNKNGIVFVLDEMITGFRWNLNGAQSLYGVKPDLSTFGKAMANGFSVACLAGKSEIMKLGATLSNYEERVFLTSTTHGAEMSGLGAFVGTVKFMVDNRTIEKNWNYGAQLKKIFEELIGEFGLESTFKISGPACSPVYSTFENENSPSLGMKTLFMQEMISNGVLMPWIAIAHRHGPRELERTESALRKTFRTLQMARDKGLDNYLVGPIVKPVFRKST